MDEQRPVARVMNRAGRGTIGVDIVSRQGVGKVATMKARAVARVLIAALVMPLLPACNTTPTQEGAVAGAALGAGAGAIIGHQQGKQGEGALIGAAAGALAGALIGDQVDERRSQRQTQQVQQVQAAPPSSGTTVFQKGHYETRVVKTESGETYEERVWVPAR